jgi:hypothetical protein
MRDEFISLAHRDWGPAERSGVKIYEMTSLASQREEFKKELLDISLKKPISEMITTDQGSMDLLEKVRVDVDFGLADTPLLYQSL